MTLIPWPRIARTWTKSDDETLRRLAREGYGASDIGVHLIPPRTPSAVRSRAVVLGLSIPGRRQVMGKSSVS